MFLLSHMKSMFKEGYFIYEKDRWVRTFRSNTHTKKSLLQENSPRIKAKILNTELGFGSILYCLQGRDLEMSEARYNILEEALFLGKIPYREKKQYPLEM